MKIPLIALDVAIGQRPPKFFVPVYRYQEKRMTSCWIFWIAPFILAGRIFKKILWVAWRDLCYFDEDLQNHLKDNYEDSLSRH